MRSSLHARLGLFLLLLLVLTAGLGFYTSSRGAAQAAVPRIWLSQKVAPPTASVQVNGGGFGQSENVNVDFDTTQITMATTDLTGKFVIRITIPKTALPGSHTIQATGQTSGLAVQTAFLVQTDWAQNGFGPSHTNNNPFENVLNSANVSGLTPGWSYNAPDIFYTTPVIANGIAFVASVYPVDMLYALDASTGVLKWNVSLGLVHGYSPLAITPLAVVNNVIYIGLGMSTGKLEALDATTGAVKWHFKTTSQRFSIPTVANGVVYFGSGKKLYALDAMTGTLKWLYTGAKRSYSTQSVANSIVYASSNDNTLYALDATTGLLKWSFMSAISPPAVASGVVYISSSDGKIHALNAATGAQLWTSANGNSGDPPAVANGVVYSVSGPNVYALNAGTGALLWKSPSGGYTTPIVVNGIVYVSDGNALYTFHLVSMSSKG